MKNASFSAREKSSDRKETVAKQEGTKYQIKARVMRVCWLRQKLWLGPDLLCVFESSPGVGVVEGNPSRQSNPPSLVMTTSTFFLSFSGYHICISPCGYFRRHNVYLPANPSLPARPSNRLKLRPFQRSLFVCGWFRRFYVCLFVDMSIYYTLAITKYVALTVECKFQKYRTSTSINRA